MNNKSPFSTAAFWLAAIGAIWMLGIGIIHFPMGYTVTGLQDFSSLPPNAADFVIMLCLVIGLLLTTVSILSFYFLKKLRDGDPAARLFFLTVGIAILARTLVEVLYPIALPEPDWTNTLTFFIFSLTYIVPAALMAIRKPDTSGPMPA